MSFKKYMIGILFCLVAVLSWGGMFPVMTPALKIMDPFYFTLFRYGSVAIIFAIILFIFEGKSSFSTEGKTFKIWFLGTLAFAGFSFLVFLGQKVAGTSGAIIASIMMAVQPLLSILVNWLIHGNKPSKVSFISMVIAAIGVFMVVTKGKIETLTQGGSSTAIAAILILLGALCWVVYTGGSSEFPKWSVLRYTALTSIYGMVSVIVIVAIATIVGLLKFPSLLQMHGVLGALIYMTILAGVIAVFSWNMGNRIIKPTNGILFMNLVPITAFVITVIGGYKISFFELFGCALTIIALVINNMYIRKQN